MGARDNPEGSNYELGELDLDLGARGPRPAPAPPQAAPRAQAPAPASNDNWRGRTDHLVGNYGDDGDDPLNAPESLPMPELDDELPRGGSRLSGTRTQREAEAAENDPRRRAQKLGDYGPTPGGLFGCVPYVVKVVTRQQQLSAERKQLVKGQQDLKARLDEALLELGRALSAQPPERLVRIKESLDAVLMARGAAETADQNAAERRREIEGQMRDLDAQILELKEAIAPFAQAEAEASQRLATLDNEHKRAQAALNRVDIERRAIETAEGQVDPARDQELHARRLDREAELQQAQEAADEARAKHEHASQQLAEKQREIDKLSAARRKLADQAEKDQRKLESAALGAEGELTVRLRDLGRAANDMELYELGGDRARLVRELDRQYSEAAEEKHLYELAHKAYDRGAVLRGVGLVVGALGAVAALVSFL